MRLLRLTGMLPAFLVGPVPAAQWTVVPVLSASETFTDNVRLAPAGSERSDWVTQVTPGVTVTAAGSRLRFDAAYSAQFLSRFNEETKDVFHQLNAKGNAELVQQLLFVDTSAAVFQSNVSLLGPQADSNINNTGNRTNVRTFLISPYLHHAFGNYAQGEARLTYSTVNTDSTGSLSNSQATGVNLSLGSGPSFKLYTWNLAYSKQNIDYNSGTTTQNPNIDTETVSAFGRRLLTPYVAVLSTVGYEDNNYITDGPAPKGLFWSTGFEWTPTPRTRLLITTGRRYFGPNRALDFSHRTRLTVWSVNYSEDITTTRSQFFVPSSVSTAGFLDTLFLSSIPDPAARQTAVQNFITQNGLPPSLNNPLNFFTNIPFLTKGWRASFGILGTQNSVMANVFTQTRFLTSGIQPGVVTDLSLTSSSKQTGASLLWTTRISSQTSSNVSAGYTRSESPEVSREDRYKFIRLSLTHQFQPRLNGSLNYRWLQDSSNQTTAAYTENAVTATVNMSF